MREFIVSDSRINLYHNLSVLLNSGVPITRAFETAHKEGKYGRLLTQIAVQVSTGQSLTEIAEKYPRYFKQLDRTLIGVGEQTGQLVEMFEMLSQWYSFRQRLRRSTMAGMIYPILMIHALAFIGPVVPFALNGFDISIYISGMLSILAIFYLPAIAIGALLYFTPKQGPLRWVLDSFVIRLPLLGKAIRELELSRYAKIFAITYKAGVPILRCAQMAIDSVANRLMHKKLSGGLECAVSGNNMSSGFAPTLPADFINLWQVGEDSGELDNATRRLADLYAERAEMRFTMISRVFPWIVYFIVAAVMVYYIFKGYSQIYGNLTL